VHHTAGPHIQQLDGALLQTAARKKNSLVIHKHTDNHTHVFNTVRIRASHLAGFCKQKERIAKA
jgi:hypothetical protein